MRPRNALKAARAWSGTAAPPGVSRMISNGAGDCSRGKHARIAIANDALVGIEPIDDHIGVARENALGGGQRRRDKLLRRDRTAGERIHARGVAIGVQGHEPIEALPAQLALEDAHLGEGRSAPELAVEVNSAARAAGAADEADGIADRIRVEIHAAQHLRIGRRGDEQFRDRDAAGGLIAMDQPEQRETHLLHLCAGPAKDESRERQPLARVVGHDPEDRGFEPGLASRQPEKRPEQLAQAPRRGHVGGNKCGGGHHGVPSSGTPGRRSPRRRNGPGAPGPSRRTPRRSSRVRSSQTATRTSPPPDRKPDGRSGVR